MQNIRILWEKETYLITILMVLAFSFSIAVRMVWVYHFGGVESMMFNGQLMLNLNDGYYFAEGARDILAGFHQKGDGSPIDNPVSQLTAFFVKITPFSFESVIFYLPAILSSLIVIPLILIGKNLKKLEMGFIAAIFASIAWSYYNRTLVGSYDTDMLNIVFPTFLLCFLILAINSNEHKYLLLTGFVIISYRWWYLQSYALEVAFFGLILLYTLIFDRKNIYNYKLIAIILVAMVSVDYWINFVAVIGLFLLFKKFSDESITLYLKAKNFKNIKLFYIIFGIILLLSLLTFFILGGFDPII